ncbi:hypothetical protein [Rhizobium rhizosphaerae]|uniref:hypothetical protein n=1 Tax=Xaviernesmea rhizosphaerae TaxID=1672749 RepID=UPI000A4409BD|nr:hypothetical protein [Xaviernesmea rhizosphaerae]
MAEKSLIVTTTWRNDNPGTIWNQLALRLGRQPTNAEVAAECRQIMREARSNANG